MTPTIDMLMERVYRHYPRGLAPDESDPDQVQYRTSEEFRRLVCVQETAAKSSGHGFYAVPGDQRVAIDPDVQLVVSALRAWRSFAERWRNEYPDLILWDESNPWHDASYRYGAARPGFVPPAPPHDGEVEASIEPDRPDVNASVRRDPVMSVVSVLAPVYAIYTYDSVPGTLGNIRYRDFPDRYQDRIAKLGSLTEEIFGFARVGEEVLRHPVPDVVPFSSNCAMGEATLMDCLFTACP